jgi:hypothetical protein
LGGFNRSYTKLYLPIALALRVAHHAGFKTLIFHQSAQADLVFVAATSSRQGLS